MGVISRNSISFSIIVYIGIALGYLNTIMIFPHILSEEEFGLTRILMSFSSVVAQFSLLGTGNILMRFHPYFKDESKNITLSVGLLISGSGLIIAAVFLYLAEPIIINQYSENSELFTDFYGAILPFVLALVFFSLFDAYLRVILRNNLPAFLNYILLRLLWLLVVLLYFQGFYDLEAFIKIYVGCQALIAVIALLYIIYLGKLQLTFKFNKYTLLKLREMSGFGLFTVISGLSLYLINRIDILMIGKYIGLEAVAVYTIAFYISTVIIVPAQSISRTAGVLAADAEKNNNLNMLDELYKKTALNQFLLGGIVFLLILLNYNTLLTFLPNEYRSSYWIFAFLGVSKLVDIGFGINGAIILNSKYYKFDTYLSILLLVLTVITNIILIPELGILGAAIATAFSVIVFNILKFLFIKRKMNLSPFTLNYGMAFLIIIVSFVIPALIPDLKIPIVDLVMNSGIAVIIFTILIIIFNVSPELTTTISSLIQKIFKK